MPIQRSNRRILDFDIETVNASFDDPQWSVNRTVAYAFAWVDDAENITVDALPVSDFYDKDLRREFLGPLLEAIGLAGVVTGHNLFRFDLPVLQAECLLLNLPKIRPVLVQDTIRVGKTKGFKKGQDNMSHALGVSREKQAMNWAEWEEAYGELNLLTVKERAASDVAMHMEMRAAMIDRKLIMAPRLWG